MTKRADLGLETLFCTNVWTLLRMGKKLCAQCRIDKMSWCRGLKTLFWTNSCNLLKMAKKCCTQCGSEKTGWSRAENSVLYKLVHFAENRQKVVRPVRKWQNVLISGAKNAVWTNSRTLLKIAKPWCARCENDKTCWSQAENAVLYKLVHFAKNCKKVVRPVPKWQNGLISRWKRCFVQTRVLCWKC